MRDEPVNLSDFVEDTSLSLLTVAQMAAADADAIQNGVPGTALMEAAGLAVTDVLLAHFTPTSVLVLCGPGNNGGDGFVVARHLWQRGWPVRVALLGEVEALTGDAAWAAGLWPGPVERFDSLHVDSVGLVVDAVFGAGLSRPVQGVAASVLAQVQACGAPVVAVDVPSGVCGDTGQVLGMAVAARLTVSFFRPKPGHVLLPARALCGQTVFADIGIDSAALTTAMQVRAWRNQPGLWPGLPAAPKITDHKYTRGHVLIVGGPMTGAARLATMAAQRMGAGLVTLAAPADTALVHRVALPSAIVAEVGSVEDVLAVAARPSVSALLVGPGGGADARMRALVVGLLALRKPTVLDADALTAFRAHPAELVSALHERCVLTPHGGEFARLFASTGLGKLADARQAAATGAAVVVYKGSDTVIAAPDGRAVINDNAPPELAVAGTGDVLAGLLVALMGQGASPFAAACCAVWCHGAAAARLGPGLLAEDLPAALPGLLADLRKDRAGRSFP